LGLNWIKVDDISFNWLLMLDKVHAVWLADFCKDEKTLGIALKGNPSVYWYLKKMAPEREYFYEQVLANAPKNLETEKIREAEIKVMKSINDWLLYVYNPETYDNLDFTKWNDSELTDIVDFKGKRVIDVGSGTGRLAFVGAKEARVVYAVEPVTSLRRYLKEKAKKMGYNNFFVVDGIVEGIPFEDDFADILLAGHVFGDNLEIEYAGAERVIKDGGEMILFPGANANDKERHDFYIKKGFDWKEFEEPGDGMMRTYWKKITK
jgi:SAM-dependent methyltransferase